MKIRFPLLIAYIIGMLSVILKIIYDYPINSEYSTLFFFIDSFVFVIIIPYVKPIIKE